MSPGPQSPSGASLAKSQLISVVTISFTLILIFKLVGLCESNVHTSINGNIIPTIDLIMDFTSLSLFSSAILFLLSSNAITLPKKA